MRPPEPPADDDTGSPADDDSGSPADDDTSERPASGDASVHPPVDDEESSPTDDPVSPTGASAAGDTTRTAAGEQPPATRHEEHAEEPDSVPIDDDAAPNTLLNALIGGVITVVTSFVPLSPIIGGAVAGYLEGGDNDAGLKVGALAGLVALVPLLLFVPFLLFFFLLDPALGIGIFLIGGFIAVFALAYAVGLSALGGVIGVYLKDEL